MIRWWTALCHSGHACKEWVKWCFMSLSRRVSTSWTVESIEWSAAEEVSPMRRRAPSSISPRRRRRDSKSSALCRRRIRWILVRKHSYSSLCHRHVQNVTFIYLFKLGLVFLLSWHFFNTKELVYDIKCKWLISATILNLKNVFLYR